MAVGSIRSSATVTRSPMYRCERTNVVPLSASMTTTAHLRATLTRRGTGRLRSVTGRMARLGPDLYRGSRLRQNARDGRGVQFRPAAGERPLVEELHVHRVVLEQRRARDHRHVVVAFGEDLRERVEPDEPSLDRSEPELPRPVELDPGEVEINWAVGRADELLHDRVELLCLLEARALARRDVRKVEDGNGPLHPPHELEDLLARTEDVRMAARLDRQSDGPLRELPEPVGEVRDDFGELLDGVAAVPRTVEAEVRV